MAKDKNKSSEPLFEDPFADLPPAPDDDATAEDAESRKRSSKKSKPASRKRTTKKTTPKPKRKKKTKAVEKPKTKSSKRTTKTASKAKREKKPAAAKSTKAGSRKRTTKKATPKPDGGKKAKAAEKPDGGPDSRREEARQAPQMEGQQPPGEGEPTEPGQAVVRDADQGRALLETLLATIDADDQEALDRATLAALPFVQRVDEVEGKQHVIFTLAEREYAVAIERVLEIGEPLHTTPVPNVPPWVLGVANLRGDIVSVVDLRAFVGLPQATPGQEPRMLVAQSSDAEVKTCFVVDQVSGIRYFNPDERVEHTSPVSDLIAHFIDGKFEDDGQEYTIMNFDRLLSSERMQTK